MNNLLQFLNESYTAFHAVKNVEKILKDRGFTELCEDTKWEVEENKNYYIKRNSSSIIAVKIPALSNIKGFNIVASHSDSPSYKLKPNASITDNIDNFIKLNVEPYGGMIDRTWFDRKLGIAGRVFTDTNPIEEILINTKETLVIPSVAIHLTRGSDLDFNPQYDMLPLLGDATISLEEILTNYTNHQKIIASDLFLYNKEEASLIGSHNEYILSPRLDDLECVYTSLISMLNAKNNNISVIAIFNNEEVGSMSSNGAGSDFLVNVLRRITNSLNLNYEQLLANSFLVSADNAHAVHPNHPEKSDQTNHVYLNEGLVIKHQAGLRYTTDGFSEAVFKEICKSIEALYQDYTNRSDQRGGSTLGAILQSHLSIPSIDIGLPQLAMHSAVELAGSSDVDVMIRALTKFFEVQFIRKNNSITIQ